MQNTAQQVKRKKRAMQPGEITLRTLMMHRQITVSELAQRLNRSQGFISQVISGQRRSRVVEAGISKILGIARSSIWTET